MGINEAVLGKARLRPPLNGPSGRHRSPKARLASSKTRSCHQREKIVVRKQKNKRKKKKFIKPLMAIKISREARELLERRSSRASRFLDAILQVDAN